MPKYQLSLNALLLLDAPHLSISLAPACARFLTRLPEVFERMRQGPGQKHEILAVKGCFQGTGCRTEGVLVQCFLLWELTR